MNFFGSSRTKFLWAIIVAIVVYSFANDYMKKNANGEDTATPLNYTEFVTKVSEGQVGSVEIEGATVYGRYKNETKTPEPNKLNVFADAKPPYQFKVQVPANDAKLIDNMLAQNVDIVVRPANKPSIWMTIFLSFGPMVFFILLYVWFMNRMQKGKGGGPFSFGKSPAKLIKPEDNKVTWDEVKGIDEAKEDLQEIVEFLKNPEKFRELGGKIPKGVLLSGSPGCGKTHLSRALAHEAGAHFFTLSGSDFVEMFVGVGASRVRSLFEEARKHSPAIIFIDEIDAVGRHRGAGTGMGNDEREQTLNALLVEMDGFDQKGGVVVIAATNRPDVLDPALLRPGRFDRQVVVPTPDIKGREDILEVYLKSVPLDPEVDIKVLARGTPGFSGAELANLVNEAALIAARREKKFVDMIDFEFAKDKIIMGAERRSTAMSENEKRVTAYHESGHAIVNLALTETDPVHKVTIIPRGRALGVTMMLPERDQYGHSRTQLKQQIAVLLGGRVAEELYLGNITTGASDDIRRATALAQNMVGLLGMSEKLGPIRYVPEDMSAVSWSDDTKRAVDEEVRRLVTEGYELAKAILTTSQTEVHKMAEMLLDKETLDSVECEQIMGNKRRAFSIETCLPAPFEKAV